MGENNYTKATAGTDGRPACCVTPYGVSDKRYVVAGAIPILNAAEDVYRGAFSAVSSTVEVKYLSLKRLLDNFTVSQSLFSSKVLR